VGVLKKRRKGLRDPLPQRKTRPGAQRAAGREPPSLWREANWAGRFKPIPCEISGSFTGHARWRQEIRQIWLNSHMGRQKIYGMADRRDRGANRRGRVEPALPDQSAAQDFQLLACAIAFADHRGFGNIGLIAMRADHLDGEIAWCFHQG